MNYLLDSNVVSAVMENREAAISRVSRIAPTDTAYLSAISQGELLFGLLNAPPSNRERLSLRFIWALDLLGGVIPIDEGVAQAYSGIRYDLKVRGRSLPDNDLWIAATAMANDYVLVSHDEGFRHVTGLKLEDWLD